MGEKGLFYTAQSKCDALAEGRVFWEANRDLGSPRIMFLSGPWEYMDGSVGLRQSMIVLFSRPPPRCCFFSRENGKTASIPPSCTHSEIEDAPPLYKSTIWALLAVE